MNKNSVFFFFSFLLVPAVFAGTYSTYPPLGTIKGALIEYYDSDEVTVSPGYGDCNGKYWEITSAITLNVDTLLAAGIPSGEDFIYIYIDDSAASYPSLTSSSDFAASITEPSWSSAKMGWYNGSDRCIGVVWSAFGTSTLTSFRTKILSDQLIQVDYQSAISILVSAVTPTGSWINLDGTLGTTDSSSYVPVNATHYRVYLYAQDLSDWGRTYVSTPEEQSIFDAIASGGVRIEVMSYVALDASRDLAWKGESNDDANSVYVEALGFYFSR